MMIVIVVLHMVQVFVFGAYKKPRETTWMLGVVLLLLTLQKPDHKHNLSAARRSAAKES
jgi:hypothetical protein